MPKPTKQSSLAKKEDQSLSKTVLRDGVVKALDSATRGLAAAVTIPQVNLISNVAAAQEVFSTRQRLGEEVIGHAHSLKIVAQAKLGDLIIQAPKAKGTRGQIKGGRKGKPGGSPGHPPGSGVHVPTLAAQGVDKKTANVARKLAALSTTELNAVAARDKTLAQVTREQTAKVRETRLSLPDAKHRVVYADPPWKYNDKADAGSVQAGGAERKYPVMSIEELCAVDVKGICDKDAVLFLWVTSPLLFECAPVITAWGFKYKASIVWDKSAHNMGHYVSVQHEFLLICTRGSATPDSKERLRSIVSEKRGKHSAKPETFRTMIDAMYTTGKRIELFARKAPPSPWEAFGNEL